MALYDLITQYCSEYCSGCREYKAVCPDCGIAICVTCQDGCDGCGKDLW